MFFVVLGLSSNAVILLMMDVNKLAIQVQSTKLQLKMMLKNLPAHNNTFVFLILFVINVIL